MLTTLRLRNDHGVTDGEWCAETLQPYHYALLKDYQDSEPTSGWHFETRGYAAGWHRYELPART